MSLTKVFQENVKKNRTFSSSDGRGGDMGKIDKAHVLLPGLEVIVKNRPIEIMMIVLFYH